MRAARLAVLVIAAAGCSTTGSHVESWAIACNQEVRLDVASINETEQAHVVGINSVLARHGLRLVSDPQAETPLQLRFDLSTGNPFNFRSTIVLLDRGTPIVSAESVNPGWGNLIVRGGNIRAIVRRSTKRFGKELDRVQGASGGLTSECS